MFRARQRVSLVAVALLVLLGMLASAAPTAAQLATPPVRIYGSVTVAGQPPAAGTVVVAFVGATACGSGSVAADGSYVLDVRSAAAQAGCGVDGAIITFTVAGRRARETAVYQSGAFIQRHLSVGAPEAHVTVERWARYADEPCAEPLDGIWCITTYPLPPAREPFARYQMLAFLRDGRVVSPTGWIVVTPDAPTARVTSTRERGVVRVVWERWTLAGATPCAGRRTDGWCIEAVEVAPPVTGTVWYRLVVTRPDGAIDEPTGFIPASP